MMTVALIGPCGRGGSHLGAHGIRRDERFAGEVAAAFGQLLVFELNRGGAGPLQFDDGAFDVGRVAEAGVGVDDHRRADLGREVLHLLDELGEREQADIGHADDAGREGCAGQIHGGEAHVLDQTAHEGVGGAGHLDGAVGDRFAQELAGSGRWLGHGNAGKTCVERGELRLLDDKRSGDTAASARELGGKTVYL